MKRRDFVTLLGGAAAWPLAARAQQGERRRIGVLMSAVEGDQKGLECITAFAQGLAELVRIEYRWGAGDLDRFRRYTAELIALETFSGAPLLSSISDRYFARYGSVCSMRPSEQVRGLFERRSIKFSAAL